MNRLVRSAGGDGCVRAGVQVTFTTEPKALLGRTSELMVSLLINTKRRQLDGEEKYHLLLFRFISNLIC